MLPPIPKLSDYGISPEHGFLPAELPLERLPDPYYHKWEAIATNLQGLILSKRLRGVVDQLPVLSTAGLEHDSEWRRAYSLLCFMAHGYIWSGEIPSEQLPAAISIPLIHISEYLEVPPVATYAAVCLWNFKLLFSDEVIDDLENIATLTTFTGSSDESWFYLVSVAIEARGAVILPLMLAAIDAARHNDSHVVIDCLRVFAERLDELSSILQRMHENCDPHVFYHRIRPFLAGSKNMEEAGLPNGVIYDDETGTAKHRQYSGGSNAQSSLIQFFDIVLGIEHRPTGDRQGVAPNSGLSKPTSDVKNNFLLDMRNYMPGPHRRFLEDVALVSNIREYVETHPYNHDLTLAYDACLAMLRNLREKHINLVSRYIILKSRETQPPLMSPSPGTPTRKIDLATSSSNTANDSVKASLRGTGGSALIPFLKQARDETGEPAVDAWAKRILNRDPRSKGRVDHILGKVADGLDNSVKQGVAATLFMDNNWGGICHF